MNRIPDLAGRYAAGSSCPTTPADEAAIAREVERLEQADPELRRSGQTRTERRAS